METVIKEYFDDLYDELSNLNLKIDLLHEIVFSITAVKFDVRPAYLLTYHGEDILQNEIYHILIRYDPKLYYYSYDKLGIIVSNTELGYMSREKLFSKLGLILGFNYNIP